MTAAEWKTQPAHVAVALPGQLSAEWKTQPARRGRHKNAGGYAGGDAGGDAPCKQSFGADDVSKSYSQARLPRAPPPGKLYLRCKRLQRRRTVYPACRHRLHLLYAPAPPPVTALAAQPA